MEKDAELPERMNTTIPFQTQFRNDLTLKRRSQGVSRPMESMESDSTVPFEGGSMSPHGPAGLQAAWDKLYKARAILEAEQVHLRDDRIALQGEIDLLQQREENVAARELRIQQLELQYQMQIAAAQDAQAEKDSQSALTRLTRAPFDMARSVFGKKE
jgi:Holliday junction resolvase-like predicted endonuclease